MAVTLENALFPTRTMYNITIFYIKTDQQFLSDDFL